ncbi:MAG: fused MFS/spermidine synthase [Candidatus Wallbacteria bacterium]|nr:fused MFS/spermidine synthase [Candidatus Wallbacteria bacterium]
MSTDIDNRTLLRRICTFLFTTGLCSLVYQVVWMRMLIRVFGCTTYAVSTAVSVFMAGLAIGGWLAVRVLRRRVPLIRTYALLELGVVCSGLVSTLLLQVFPGVYAELYTSFSLQVAHAFLRLVLCSVVLLPPTILMGMTLPMLVQFHETVSDRPSGTVALLYGINTLGAVLGVVLAGFLGIGYFGESSTIGAAFGLNAMLAVAAFITSRSFGGQQQLEAIGATSEAGHCAGGPVSRMDGLPGEVRAQSVAGPEEGRPPDWVLLGLFGASGACALGYEILWNRSLILLLGTSVYAFSCILAVYLIGVALGSLSIRRRLKQIDSPLAWFAWLEIAVGVVSAASRYYFAWLGLSRPALETLYSPLLHPGDLANFFLFAFVIVFPVTFLLGMMFPVMVEAFEPSGRRGPRVGRVYAWNTWGCVLGSWLTGFVGVSLLGTDGCFKALVVGNLVVGLLALLALHGGRLPAVKFVVCGAVSLACVAVVSWIPSPFRTIVDHRIQGIGAKLLYHDEGIDSNITGMVSPDQSRVLLVNGIIISGNGLLGRALTDISLLLHPDPKRMFAIGFGVGNTFRTALLRGAEIDIAELSPVVVRHFPDYYADAAVHLADPRGRVSFQDGRTHLLTTDRDYDIIVVDGSPPIFASGTVNLYSREFIQLAKRRMRPGGILLIWVPLTCHASSFWMIARNMSEAFSSLTAYAYPWGAGVFLYGSDSSLEVDEAVLSERMRARGRTPEVIGLDAAAIHSGRILEDGQIRRRASSFPPVTDDEPWTEFPLSVLLRGEPLQYDWKFLYEAKQPAG